MVKNRFCYVFFYNLYQSLDCIGVLAFKKVENIGKADFLRVVFEVHYAVDVIYAAVMWCHVLLAEVFKSVDKAAEEKVSDYWKDNTL